MFDAKYFSGRDNALEVAMRAEQRGQKLRYWIGGGYAIPVIFLLISAVVVGMNVQVVRRESERLATSNDISEKINDLGFEAQSLSRSTRGYMLDPDPVSLGTYNSAKQGLETIKAELNTLITNDQQRENFTELERILKQLIEINDSLVVLAQQGQVPEAIARWRQDKGRDVVESAVQALEQMKTLEQSLVTESQVAQSTALDRLMATLVGATLLSALLSAATGTWLITSITRQITNTASIVASASAEIAATIEEQERTAAQQAASVNETTTTMDELSASSRQSAEQAQAAASGAQNVLDLSEQGTQAVEKTLEGMGNLKVKVAAIAEQILHLSEQTSQIGNISGLVSDLANQTNMLALNAAVEAVRAGEHGRGFAVVAGEIRKLADQSKRSAERINALVGDVQSAINSTVMVTDEGTKTVEDGVMIARNTADTFANMASSLDNVAISSQQISLNAKQQAIAIQQVVDAMTSLNSAAKEMASGISQVKVGTQNLNQATVTLKSIM
jgi:CHASE3 domain sensor protein